MAWKMEGMPKVRRLTRALAQKFCEMEPAPHDRPLSARRCDVLKLAFDNKKFRTCEWASAYCKETKKTYRINGKHTSTVLTQMNGSMPNGLSIVVEEYVCDTLEDVANLYSTFDPRTSARTSSDINRIYAAVCPELDDVSSRLVNLAITSISYQIWEDNYPEHSPEDRAKLIVSNTDFALFLNDLAEGLNGTNQKFKHILRGPVGAAIYATFKKNKAEAKKFWEAVRDASEKSGSPTRLLERYLLTTGVRAGRGRSKTTTNHEMYVRCIHAWNAWRKGEITALRYYQGCSTPAAA